MEAAMEDTNKKNEILKVMTDIEYYSPVSENEISLAKYTKLSLANVSALGIAFEPLTSVLQSITQTGGEGVRSTLCKVTIPNGVSGHLAKFHDGSGFTATVVNKTGIAGQARINPLVCDPTMLFMAVALMNIEKKLDSIQEIQQEILEFLEQKEKSRLKGNLNVLTDVLNNYKYNWNNEKYKTNKHIQVQEIKRDAEQSIIFYREQIDKKIKKQSFLHSDQDVNIMLKKTQSEFNDYQLALYLYSFSSFLEVMLLENFEAAYLDSVAHKIEDYSYQYRELYTKSYDQIEWYAKSSIQSHLLSGLASFSRVAGDVMAKVPVVSKSQLDENLIGASGQIGKISSKKAEKTMGRFVNNQSCCVRPFVENINAVNRLYNQPMELLFDKENLYIGNTQF
jgi:hypothetical protein